MNSLMLEEVQERPDVLARVSPAEAATLLTELGAQRTYPEELITWVSFCATLAGALDRWLCYPQAPGYGPVRENSGR